MSNLQDLLLKTLGGNTVGNYLYTLLLFCLLIILFKIFTNYILTRLESAAKKTKMNLDNILVKVVMGIKWPLYFSLALYISSRILALEASVEKGIWYILVILLTYEGVRALQNIIEYCTEKAAAANKKDGHSIKIISKAARAALWIVAVILILSNLGYNVSSLIAGLGIGGIAVALALQNILGDVFNSFSIYLDKPFQTGDYIEIDDTGGTVKKIGLKTTRIESLQGEEIVISNQDLTSSRIHNFKKMQKRRVDFVVGVAYETKQTALKQIPKIVKDVFEKIKMTELDRVYFKEFGDFSLNFEIVFYVKTGEYKKYTDIQQRINLALKEAFDKKGIAFAYPTQTVFVKGDAPVKK